MLILCLAWFMWGFIARGLLDLVCERPRRLPPASVRQIGRVTRMNRSEARTHRSGRRWTPPGNLTIDDEVTHDV